MRQILLCFLLCSALSTTAGCDDAPTAPEETEEERLTRLTDALFAPAEPAEVEAVLAEWSTRDPMVEGYEEITTSTFSLTDEVGAELRVVAHQIDGLRHYGAFVVPEGAAPGSLPVVVVAHGGDGGADVDELLEGLEDIGDVAGRFVYVIPSFRSEPLEVGTQTYRSAGDPSPWDRDVDDALALLEAALQNVPAADDERIAAVGFSRGGTVALLMAIRDARIDLVAEFFGPTDFFDGFVRSVVELALRGVVVPLPGFEALNEMYLQPFVDGTLPVEEVRRELVRRSPVLFASRLPPLQIHHGTNDRIVPVAQGQALDEALRALGPAAPPYEYFEYPGGGHDLESLEGSLERLAGFLGQLLTPAAAYADGVAAR